MRERPYTLQFAAGYAHTTKTPADCKTARGEPLCAQRDVNFTACIFWDSARQLRVARSRAIRETVRFTNVLHWHPGCAFLRLSDATMSNLTRKLFPVLKPTIFVAGAVLL